MHQKRKPTINHLFKKLAQLGNAKQNILSGWPDFVGPKIPRLWECRKNKIPPKLRLFLHKVEAKQEVEKIIAIKNRKLRDFYTRWELLL